MEVEHNPSYSIVQSLPVSEYSLAGPDHSTTDEKLKMSGTIGEGKLETEQNEGNIQKREKSR